MTCLEIKISAKTDQLNTDNVFPLKFDHWSAYSNVKANTTTFELLNENLLLRACVERRPRGAGVTFS
jgi:hypothetical protein